jgi:phosphoribosylformylglycinamidine synthase
LPLSQYALHLQAWEHGAPPILDLDLERRVQACVRDLISMGAVSTATDVSEGGLAVALAELSVVSGVGVSCEGLDVDEGGATRADATLFGEAPSRIIVAADDGRSPEVEGLAGRWNVELTRLGVSGGDAIRIGRSLSVTVSDAHARWAGGMEQMAERYGGRDAAS